MGRSARPKHVLALPLLAGLLAVHSAKGKGPTLSLKERCQRMFESLGPNEIARLEAERTQSTNSLRNLWKTHIRDNFSPNLPFSATPALLDNTRKLLEMQRDTFNEWHRDTGLVASLDYQEVTLGGRPVTDRTPNSAKTVRIPYLNFRYSPELAKEPVSTRIGAKLINIFKGKHNNLNVTYDPVRQLLLIEQSASLYVSPMPGSPKSKILISDADFFSIDTVPIGLIHEHGHHKVKTSERPDDSAQSSRSFRHVFGEARVNQSSEVFHSVYLKGSGGQFPRLNFEEIYTFWISAKSALFNLKQRLQTPDTSIKEISSALDELKYSVRHLRAISLDARYLYDEVDALLKRPNSVINIRRSGDKLFLVTSIYPSRSQSKYLKVPPDQIPSSLKIDVEIPIELEPPSLWILRFMEIEGRAPSTTGLSPLPNEFRADFEKGMSERIAYLQNRLAGAVKTGDNLEGFLRENPEPTREQLEALVKIL